jgi:4-hydroxybenzoyl-CoA thioesterase
MDYIHRTTVRFAHVDAAGIVFYPRYFEMLNAAVEDWFAEDLNSSFKALHLEQRIGTPTVQLESEFVSPAMLGDLLDIHISPKRVGNSSSTFAFTFLCDNAVRMRGTAVLVCIDLDSQKSRSWPDAIKSAMLAKTQSNSDDRVS